MATDERPRGQWSSQCDFLLSCIGYSVGVGNIWRFPYMCYKHGGGTFLVPYVVMVAAVGVPMYVMELTLGQYAGVGPNVLFRKLTPLFSGLGYAMLLLTALISFSYNMVVAWAIFYTAASLTSALEWSHCDHNFNSRNCYTTADDTRCWTESNGTEIFWNGTCYSARAFCEEHGFVDLNGSYCRNGSRNEAKPLVTVGSRVLSSEEYFVSYVLGLQNYDCEGLGSLKWDLSLCLMLAWILISGCLFKGIKYFGRIIYFTVLVPYLLCLILAFKTTFLHGAKHGMLFYITPDSSRLWDVEVWSDAATQMLFSLGVGMGCLIMLASYNRRNNNCVRDAFIVSAVNTLTSLMFGLVVFSMMGFLACHMHTGIQDVVATHSGLAFVTYPEALASMSGSPVWSTLFFVMLITLGLDTQLVIVETLTTAVFDEWPQSKRSKRFVVVAISLCFFLAGLTMCTKCGVLVFTLVERYSIISSMFVIALVEVLVVAWLFGAEKLLRVMQEEMGFILPTPLYFYLLYSWKYVLPVLLSVMLVLKELRRPLVSYRTKFGQFHYPDWAHGVGHLMAWAPALVLLVVGLFAAAARLRQSPSLRLWLSQLASPGADWPPGRAAAAGDEPREPVADGRVASDESRV